MREELLEQRELDKVINRFESNDLFSNLHYLNKAINLAYCELLGGAENIDTEVEKYKKLTPFDLRRIAENCLSRKIVLHYGTNRYMQNEK